MMARNLATSLILYEEVRTTHKRARVVQPIVDRLIAVAKRKSTQLAIRDINRVVTDRNACRKLLEVYRTRYASRPSGFTRLVPVGSRKGDGAKVVDVKMIEEGDMPVRKKKTSSAA
jgi:large subunit ribosomal protein L17